MSDKKTVNNENDFLMDSFVRFSGEETVFSRKKVSENPLSSTIFIVLDTETTSPETEDVYNKFGELIATKAKVIELAYSRMSPKGVSSHFEDRFYDPGEPIPPASMSVHNITDDDVAGKPKIEDEIGIIRNDIKDYPILAYNSTFDFKMLPMLQDKTWIDVYKMAVHVWHIGQENENGLPLTSFKQQELRYWLGLDKKYSITGEAHRADSDIQVTGFIFQEIKKHYLEVLNKPDDLNSFIEWVDSTPDYKSIPFGPMKVKRNQDTGKYGVKADDLSLNYLSYLLSDKNPMRSSFDSFGVTDYLVKAYTPKLEAHMRLHYDEGQTSVLSDIKSVADITKGMTEEQIASLRKGSAVNEETDYSDEDENENGLSSILNRINSKPLAMSRNTEGDIAPNIKVNTPSYNIETGVKAVAKKTRARKQAGPSYLSKRLSK